MESDRIRADIDLDAIIYNMSSMHDKLKSDTLMTAVIKADAYGHGAIEISKVLEDLPYLWGFAVATVDEAIELIESGRTKPVLILGLSFPEHYRDIIKNDIRPAVCDFDTAQQLDRKSVV